MFTASYTPVNTLTRGSIRTLKLRSFCGRVTNFPFYFWLALLLAKRRYCRVLGDRLTYGEYLGKIYGARSNTSPKEIIKTFGKIDSYCYDIFFWLIRLLNDYDTL